MDLLTDTIVWQQNIITLNGEVVFSADDNVEDLPELTAAVYKEFSISYPKFFKMDLLSRVAFLASDILLQSIDEVAQYNKEKVAVAIATFQGCLEVDKQFEESRKTFSSPGLFVYTLPNIMLGEVCIRNGFKGEQLCIVAEKNETSFMDFYVKDLLLHRNTDACLFGFAEATLDTIDIILHFTRKK